MFDTNLFIPKHQRIIKQIYNHDGSTNIQKLSFFIHYLQSKVERITKAMKYIKKRNISEIKTKTSHKYIRMNTAENGCVMSTTLDIIYALVTNLPTYSINYESSIIQIFINSLALHPKLSIDQQFLNTFDIFFKKIEIKTFKSDKLIIKLLTLLNNRDINVKHTQIEDDNHTNSSDESIIDYDNTIPFNTEPLIKSLIINVKDLCNTNYNIKYRLLLSNYKNYNYKDNISNILDNNDNDDNNDKDTNTTAHTSSTATTNSNIIQLLLKTTNIINSPTFIYYYIKYNIELEYLLSYEGLHPFILIEYLNILKEREEEIRDINKYLKNVIDSNILYNDNIIHIILGEENEHSIISFIRIGVDIINRTISTNINTLDLSKSISSYIKSYYSKKGSTVEYKSTVEIEEMDKKVLMKCFSIDYNSEGDNKISNHPNPNNNIDIGVLLFRYIFRSISNTSDIFYFILKNIFKWVDGKGSGYSLEVERIILIEVLVYYKNRYNRIIKNIENIESGSENDEVFYDAYEEINEKTKNIINNKETNNINSNVPNSDINKNDINNRDTNPPNPNIIDSNHTTTSKDNANPPNPNIIDSNIVHEDEVEYKFIVLLLKICNTNHHKEVIYDILYYIFVNNYTFEYKSFILSKIRLLLAESRDIRLLKIILSEVNRDIEDIDSINNPITSISSTNNKEVIKYIFNRENNYRISVDTKNYEELFNKEGGLFEESIKSSINIDNGGKRKTLIKILNIFKDK